MKKTTDGRFVEKRVLINKKIRKEIIYSAKIKSKLSWIGFAKKIGVSPVALQHDWLMENRTIPISIFEKLIKLSNYDKSKVNIEIIDPFWGQKLANGKPKLKKVKIPDKNSENFAEFYGILLGDGCIFSDLKGFSISGDRFLDYDYYHSYLKNLIFDLFGIYPTFYHSNKDRSIKCVVYSKSIVQFLKESGFPIGVKYYGKPCFPNFVLNSNQNLAAGIRGMMDTDGSLSAHPHSKIMIHLSITIPSLRKSVLDGLTKLGINAGEFDKGIMIYGQDKVKLFEKTIGFSNYKNNYKYSTFLEIGKVPSSKQTEMFIREKEGI